jgi:hypothetical protein
VQTGLYPRLQSVSSSDIRPPATNAKRFELTSVGSSFLVGKQPSVSRVSIVWPLPAAIFARHFPRDGGRFRRERAFFGVVTDRGGMRQIEGTAPDSLLRNLAEVCAEFNRGTAQLDRRDTGIAEQTRVVAALYAGILRVHPFADGNHRTAFVALSAALWSLGLPAVEFADDKDMTDHDSAVAPALISPGGDIEPFARLLAARIEHARNPAT